MKPNDNTRPGQYHYDLNKYKTIYATIYIIYVYISFTM